MTAVKSPGEGVCYTAKGHWRPTIPGAVCGYCGVSYTAHTRNPKFCSRSCASKATVKRVAYTPRTCPGCGKSWQAPPSNPSSYCSKECIFDSGAWARPRREKCAHCQAPFTARLRHKRGEYERFCSRACSAAASERKVTKDCANCGKTFAVQQSRSHEKTCSKPCASAYNLRDRHHAWTGGKVLQNERVYRRIDREGYAAKYEGEHRLIAAREIGRPIKRGEVILCIDRNNENLSPENLFFCPSMTEYSLIRSGAVEWPTTSNLKAMRVSGYVRPDVILTLHAWENGQRRENDKGKPITRHPQADEIITRRKAGASVRVLAKEFGYSESNMASILRKRL